MHRYAYSANGAPSQVQHHMAKRMRLDTWVSSLVTGVQDPDLRRELSSAFCSSEENRARASTPQANMIGDPPKRCFGEALRGPCPPPGNQ